MAQYINKPSYTTTLPGESIVFFGTGIVSLRSLEHIAKSYDIEAVVTISDRKTSSNKKAASLVKKWALQNKTKVVEADTAKDLEKQFDEYSFVSKLGIVVDYGVIIPEKVIDYFQLGIVNSHFSLLPQWRGADPITFAILSGQTETGISIMQINSQLDTGDIIEKSSIKIGQSETTDTLTERLIDLSNKTLDSTLPRILVGDINLVAQTGKQSYSRKLGKSDGEINWNKSAGQISREIRAYFSWPTSYTSSIDNQRISIKQAMPYETTKTTEKRPGQVHLTKNKELAVTCKDSVLLIKALQPSGKKQMTSQAFLAGRQQFSKSLPVLD